MMATETTRTDNCEIRLDRASGGALIVITGNLDWLVVSELLKDTALAEDRPRMLIDLSCTTGIDSAGTGALITTLLHERRAHKPLAIVADGRVAAVLDAVGISEVVPVFRTCEAGHSWLSTGGA
jgi:anti-anti-sigma regulatory factor